MTEQEKMLIALRQIDNIVKLTEDNEYRHYLYCKLSSVKCELERQIRNLNGTTD
jgi:hypothetical protein